MCRRALVVLLLLAVMICGSAASAGASVTGVTLPMTLPGYMAVDDAHQQLFVSGSMTEATVKVVGFDGAAVGTITQQGASGLAIANGKLYVAGCGTDTVAIYDTSTLALVDTVTTPQPMRTPCDLAVAGGRVFVDLNHGGGITRPAWIDLDAPHAGGELPNLSAGATFVTNPADAAQLATVSNGSSPVRDAVFDASAAAAPVWLGGASLAANDGHDSAALSHDGSMLYVLAEDGVTPFTLPDLTTAGSALDTTGLAFPDAVAVSPDGDRIGAGWHDQNRAGVDIFRDGETTPTRSVTFPAEIHTVRGVEFSADGSRLFVLTEMTGTRAPVLEIVDHADLPGAALTLQATPAQPIPGHPVTLSGTLGLHDGLDPVGKTLDFEMTRPDATTANLGSTVTGAGGAFQLTLPETLTQTGQYVFTVSFAGDADTAENAKSIVVTASQVQTEMTLTSPSTTIIYGRSASLTAHLTGGDPGSPVAIYRTVAGVTTLVTSGLTNASGNLTVSVKPGRNTYYFARFDGDVGHSGSRSDSRLISVAPLITGTISSGYGRSGAYHLFHYQPACAKSAQKCPLFTARLAPNHAGKRVYLVVQQHVTSGWKSVVSWHRTLGKKSAATFPIRYANTGVIGKSYRVLAVFRGDTDHHDVAFGYWYFKVTR